MVIFPFGAAREAGRDEPGDAFLVCDGILSETIKSIMGIEFRKNQVVKSV
jgi:hypothetical protein